jgi:hypothetical protein
MKFSEPLAGYKLGSGETIYHIAYMIVMLCIPIGPCYSSEGQALDYDF